MIALRSSIDFYGSVILCNKVRGCLMPSCMWAHLNHLTSGGCEGSAYGLMTSAQAEEHHTPDGTPNIWCLLRFESNTWIWIRSIASGSVILSFWLSCQNLVTNLNGWSIWFETVIIHNYIWSLSYTVLNSEYVLWLSSWLIVSLWN